ncbi:MAG TPA: adenosine deaminase [Mycobacteriales bacterium]|nr:adenosine deaminase [Mycobacteriales bacterium]
MTSPEQAAISRAALIAAPKVVLHDHLDGGLRPETLVDLGRQHGVALPSDDPTQLAAHIRAGAASGSLVRYLEPFGYTVSVMQTEPALRRVAAEAVMDLASDGAVYAEIRFAPELSTAQGLTPHQVVDAILSGFEEGTLAAAEQGHRITARALLCAMRQESRSREIAELTADYYRRGTGVVGFDIAGPEDGFPATDHAHAFDYLREHGVPVTVHAGEAAGLDSITGALDMGARRLGHGVHLSADVGVAAGQYRLGAVATRVADSGVALELCPKSNVDTCAVPSLSEHPFAQLDRAGVTVTVNTDNRLMSGTSMTEEFSRLAEEFGYGWADLRRITRNALDAAFADEALRRRILDEQIIPGYAALSN